MYDPLQAPNPAARKPAPRLDDLSRVVNVQGANLETWGNEVLIRSPRGWGIPIQVCLFRAVERLLELYIPFGVVRAQGD